MEARTYGVGGMYTVEEMLELLSLDVIDSKEVTPEVDEELVTDYIMIAGYSEEDAYRAARAVAKYDNL